MNSDYIDYPHFSHVPRSEWPWKHFTPRELACKGTGRIRIHKPTLNKLETMRRILGKPMHITSAYRSPPHNARVGGAKNSQHLEGKAYDVRLDNIAPDEAESAARSVGFTGFGFYRQQNFIHIDTGPAREWGSRWWTPGKSEAVTEAPAAAPSPVKDKGVQATALTAVAYAAKEAADAGGSFLSKLHPDAQTVALVIVGVIAGGAIYLGWGKIREMLR